MISQKINDDIRIWLYSFDILYLLFFFYKMARYPNKGYGILMILILNGTLFLTAVLKIISLFYPNNTSLKDFFRVLSKFAMLWIIGLAVYHYTILKAFKEKFRKFPFKKFIICTTLLCVVLALLTDLK